MRTILPFGEYPIINIVYTTTRINSFVPLTFHHSIRWYCCRTEAVVSLYVVSLLFRSYIPSLLFLISTVHDDVPGSWRHRIWSGHTTRWRRNTSSSSICCTGVKFWMLAASRKKMFSFCGPESFVTWNVKCFAWTKNWPSSRRHDLLCVPLQMHD